MAGFSVDPTFLAMLGGGMKKVFERCRIPGCHAHSVGLVCMTCARFVCQHHVYITAALPPRPICASCVVENHPELFEPTQGRDDSHRDQPPADGPRSSRHRGDDNTVDADFEEVR